MKWSKHKSVINNSSQIYITLLYFLLSEMIRIVPSALQRTMWKYKDEAAS